MLPSKHRPLPLPSAAAGVANGGEAAFARSFLNDTRVKKIIGSVVMREGLPFSFHDDLFQETFSIVNEYAVTGKITDPAGIYSFVYATAFNSARTIRNQEMKNGAHILSNSPEDADDRGDRELVDESTCVDRGDEVDIVRARNMIALIIKDKKCNVMQTHPLISTEKPEVRVVEPDKAKERTTARQLSPAQQELAEIITDLGYKHEEFAVDIGIGMSRLASYLYGRTMTVPDNIMARARELRDQAAPVVERWKKQFDKPMPSIILGWEKSLGLEPKAKANDDIIAGILEVNPVTVYRWRRRDTSPPIHSIAKMDGRIKEEVARRRRTSKARQAKK